MHAVAGTVFGRWYVTIFGLSFAYFAVRHMGWRKTLLYAVAALTVGALAENASVHLGFPYTRYAFDASLRGKELWLGDVPLFVPLSYTFMGYFAFAAGRLLASGPWRTRARARWSELALAWLLAVWALWVIDPISRIGTKFYLGPVFRYAGPGFWFGLPLGSQVGFAATAAVLLAMLWALCRHDADVIVERPLRHQHLPALVTWCVQEFHLAFIAIGVGAHAVGAQAFLIWIPFGVLLAVYWSALRPPPPTHATVPASAAAAKRAERVL